MQNARRDEGGGRCAAVPRDFFWLFFGFRPAVARTDVIKFLWIGAARRPRSGAMKVICIDRGVVIVLVAIPAIAYTLLQYDMRQSAYHPGRCLPSAIICSCALHVRGQTQSSARATVEN